MRANVLAAKVSPLLRDLAAQIVSGLAPKDWLGELRTVHRWVQDHIRYLHDVRDVETLQTPDFTLQAGYGDCDDLVQLTSALLETLGFPTRFVAVGFQPGVFSHVYLEALPPDPSLGTAWLPVETTVRVPVGWAPPGVQARLTLEI